jgi:hypothetical protein
MRATGPKQILTVAAVLTGTALAAVLGPWGGQDASAKTITATCADKSTDAAMLNSAIAGSQPGDQILISGQCLLTAPITLLGDRGYAGGSRTGTVLQQANGANLSYLLASDTYVDNNNYTGLPFSIRHLTINCNSTHNTAATNGLVLHSWLTTAEDLQIENCGGSGILVANTTPNGTKLNSNSDEVNGSIDGNYINNSGQYGVYAQDTENNVTDWHLDDNYISSSGLDAIHLDNAAGWFVDNNHLYGDRNNAIYANRLFGTSISNNYIEEFGQAGGATTWYGIEGTVQGDAASVIAGNRVFMFTAESAGTSYRYIAVTKVNYGPNPGNVTVTGNDIRGGGSSSDTAFYFNAGSGVTLKVTSSGNAVSSVGTARTTGTGVTLSAGI